MVFKALALTYPFLADDLRDGYASCNLRSPAVDRTDLEDKLPTKLVYLSAWMFS